MLRSAGEQREERPSRRVRTTGAAVEPRRHISAPKRVLEKAEVALRRTDEDSHLVEAHAATRLLQDAPRDFHAFPSFAGRRKQLERAVDRAFGRLQIRLE